MAPSMVSHQWGIKSHDVLCASDASLFNSAFRLVMVGGLGHLVFKTA